ncbi:uracil-DNA glycosylase [Natronosalvus halobius]|uniref:uracil-DNA glycosylase n=1 Tax=Natronosalvus halobius TaxID=2953746 RepID=UPI0020A0B6C0|nr:uracil-DNA glycosylase [Natronosalvus halobius]USZ72834.1 uracil-DNA glycosylase [Natronosalvus halobius]
MDANQLSTANPFGMDENCENCPELCAPRTQVVHGYGDVGADFLFVGERPSAPADVVGIPFLEAGSKDEGERGAGDDGGTSEVGANGGLYRILQRLGLCASVSDPEEPELANVYLTLLTRCRDPERPPTDEEIVTCEPYLNAEIRMINPEIIVPVGQRALTEIGTEYTTTAADNLEIETHHATTIRGRGFELVPMLEPAAQTRAQTQAWLEHFVDLMASDYRQTKGRQGR